MTAANATDAFHALEPLLNLERGSWSSPRPDGGKKDSARGSRGVGLGGVASASESEAGGSRILATPSLGPIVEEMPYKEQATRELINSRAIKERAMSRLRGGLHGLDGVEVSRVRSAFWRFRAPFQSEVHKDDLPKILAHLGYTMIDKEAIAEIGQEVSVFCAFDLIELCSFVERFAKFETSSMRDMFHRFDEDGSGEISCDELRVFMSALGFTPLRSAVAEALAAVDEDHSGSLSFEETVHLLEVYKSTEGFTRPEVQAIWNAFNEEIMECKDTGERSKFRESTEGLAAASETRGAGFSEGNGLVLPAERLPQVLLRHFGPSSREIAARLGKEVLSSGSSLFVGDSSQSVGSTSVNGACQPLAFQEVLLWARRFREMTFQEWKKFFLKYDIDKSGSIEASELQQLLCDLNYTLHRDVVNEYLDAADEDWEGANRDGMLDYDEFVNLMLLLRNGEGFSEMEQRELEAVFRQFDADGSGEIEVMELNGIFQYLGRVIRIEEVNRLLLQVDFNNSGSLDFREFLRMMRLIREDELRDLRRRFDSVARQPDITTIRRHQASELLTILGYPSKLDEASKDAPPSNELMKFDDVIVMLDRRRGVKVKEKRRNAGFSERELAQFKELFDSFDADRSGVLSNRELAPLLETLGLTSASAQDRDRLLEDLDRARELAIAAGVTDVSVKSSGNMHFWEMVQMLRLLYSQEDSRVLAREEAAIEETHFKRAEVDQFREFFEEWLLKSKEFEIEAKLVHKQQSIKPADNGRQDSQELTTDAMRRLLGSVGVKLTCDQRQTLDQRIRDLQNNSRVNFPDFLRLMRWMLDTDFAGILKVLKGA